MSTRKRRSVAARRKEPTPSPSPSPSPCSSDVDDDAGSSATDVEDLSNRLRVTFVEDGGAPNILEAGKAARRGRRSTMGGGADQDNDDDEEEKDEALVRIDLSTSWRPI